MSDGACILCGERAFAPLPAFWEHSMTTAGRLVAEPLAKAHCRSCGLLQRVGVRRLGETDFYERHYSFFERPGAAFYDRPRYRAMASWIVGSLGRGLPSSVLDAGCGRGWMLDAMRERLPAARFLGVEPSEQESENARLAGYPVVTAKVGSTTEFGDEFDLVYATNVVEHTTDPVDFLDSLRRALRPGGRVVVTCPDASTPNAELMFSDQNFSFTPRQLAQLAARAGLQPVRWLPAPADEPQVRDKQLLVLGASRAEADVPAGPGIDELYEARCGYVRSYHECDAYLAGEVEGRTNVYNFGTSTWSLLLSAYCPAYWSRVTACTIDAVDGDAEFQGKLVVPFAELGLGSGDALVLGVNPVTQSAFAERLATSGVGCIRWDGFVRR